MKSEIRSAIAAAIGAATGTSIQIENYQAVGGGSINRAWVIEDDQRRFFVKTNGATLAPMFEAEAAGLKALAQTNTVRVPDAICNGTAGEQAFIVLEYLNFASANESSAARLGTQLAQLHQNGAQRYGWLMDNTLGTTPQPNPWYEGWVNFLREERLRHQLALLDDAELNRLGEQVVARLSELFADYEPQPSLIHGDLWGGNWGALEGGEPVIFDPACYFADREMELAMTELFGGFPASFYTAYHQAWALDSNYEQRKPLYFLYHVLNHANLFGGGYRAQARELMLQITGG